jgi:hypothetical protein
MEEDIGKQPGHIASLEDEEQKNDLSELKIIKQLLHEQVQENAKLKQDIKSLTLSLDNQQQELLQTRSKYALDMQALSNLAQKIQSESHQEKQELLEQIT